MRSAFNPFLAASVFALVLTTPSMAQDLTGESKKSAAKEEGTSPVRNIQLEGLDEVSNGTRIIISTSGPAKFNSYWLESPPRLVIEFRTRNIISKIGNEITVEQGVIKRIATGYFGSGEKKSLKSLTFELTQKMPYKIWQEADTVILDIQTPQEISVFPKEGREIFAKNEPKEVMIERLGAMDTALTKVSTNHLPRGAALEVIAEFPKSRRKTMSVALWLMALPIGRQTIALWLMALPIGRQTIALWLIGLTLISGLGGLLFLLFCRRYKLILDKNVAACEIEKLKSQVAEKNKLLEQEGIIRETIENTSLTREKELEQLKLELQKEARLLEKAERARKAKEEELLKKEKESEQVKNSLESLKEVLVNKGLAKKISSPEGKGELWISGKSSEKRQLPRLDLSKDYNRTIILRIESPDKSKSIKSFANNIGLGGLCFETRRDFEEKEAINLRLFFFGDRVPIIKIKAEITWKKTVLPVNYYGVSFVSIEEKDKAELSHYIESKIG